MAVVYPLRPPEPAPADVTERGGSSRNVVRLVEVLGPISPELALVDPDLARKARAMLPELPSTWELRAGAYAERAAPTLPARPVALPRIHERLLARRTAVRGLGALAAASFVLGLVVAVSDRSTSAPVVVPPVATPTSAPDSAPGTRPTTAPPAVGAGASKPTSAGSGAARVTAPRFVWPAVPGAKGYRVSLYREGRQVFTEDVTSPALQLSLSWSYAGRFYRLEKGTYRWVVWPLFGKGSATRTGPVIVAAQYTV